MGIPLPHNPSLELNRLTGIINMISERTCHLWFEQIFLILRQIITPDGHINEGRVS